MIALSCLHGAVLATPCAAFFRATPLRRLRGGLGRTRDKETSYVGLSEAARFLSRTVLLDAWPE